MRDTYSAKNCIVLCHLRQRKRSGNLILGRPLAQEQDNPEQLVALKYPDFWSKLTTSQNFNWKIAYFSTTSYSGVSCSGANFSH